MTLLNAVDLRELWSELDEFESELRDEGRGLEQAWGALCDLDTENSSAYHAIEAAQELVFLPADTVIRLDIGGQSFILSVDLLTKDPFSILAGCCRMSPALLTGDEPLSFYFDRDWWLFRHIVTYLRTGMLPDEVDVLAELFIEACYYRLELLKKALEDIPLDRLQPKVPVQQLRYSRRNEQQYDTKWS